MDLRIWQRATATFWAIVVIALALILCFGRYAIGAECLSSDAEVRKMHGVTAWSTWRRVDGKKCWMEGTRHERVDVVDRIRNPGHSAIRRVRNGPNIQHSATSAEPERVVSGLVLLDNTSQSDDGTRHGNVHGRPGPRRGHSVASTANDHIKTYRRSSTRVLRRSNSLVEPVGENEVLVGDGDRRVIAAQTSAQPNEVSQWSEEPEIKRRLWIISFQSWAMRVWADGWDNVYEARDRYNGRTVHTEAVESRVLSYSEIQKVRLVY